jgi:hypothetical protein
VEAMNSHPFTLADGPLAGQEVTVYAQQGGTFPPVLYAHAPLPSGHADVPGPLHRYLAMGDHPPVYVHAPDCGGCTGVDTPHHGG